MTEPFWAFDNIPNDRLEYLIVPFDLETLIGRIQSEIRNICYKNDKGKHEAKGLWRPLFRFEVDKETFDRFYNSPHGYRGQFLADIKRGEKVNTTLISSLIDLLTESTKEMPSILERIRTSLESSYAKIWIDEKEDIPRTPDLIIQIRVPKWEAAARAVYERLKRGDSTITDKELDRIYGVRAPLGETLKVMGAWISPNGSLHTVPSKYRRSEDIRDYGFS
jgi:hypothetical protein